MNQTSASTDSAPRGKRAKRARRPISELPDGLLDLATVLDFVPFCRTTFLLYVKSGRFPSPVRLSKRVRMWQSHEIRALMSAGPRKLRAPATN